MNAPLYTPEILRLAASLQAPRGLDGSGGRAELRSPVCGSTIATEVMLDETGKVIAISQRVSACAFGQASATLVQAGACGRTADEVRAAFEALRGWLAGDRPDPGDWPGLAALAPARRKTARHAAILLPFDALCRAMDAAA